VGELPAIRLWLGEPAALGAPVEVGLRRREGGNVLAVVGQPGVGPGLLYAALVTARLSAGDALDLTVLDLGPLDQGVGEAVATLPAEWDVRVARKRSASRVLEGLLERVADREARGARSEAPMLVVVNGLPRGFDQETDGEPAPAALLSDLVRRGPEVGVHTVVACDSLDQFDQRLGRRTLADFGVCVATAIDADASMELLDSPYGSTLGPHHALLADEERARLVKFRPYLLPPTGWSA
jgi:hypothetical protein